MFGKLASANQFPIMSNGLVFFTNPRFSRYRTSTRFREYFSNVNSSSTPSFDANGDVLQANNNSSLLGFGNRTALDFTTSFTVGIWVKRNTTQTVDCGLFSKFQDGGLNGWLLWLDGAQRAQLYINAGSRTNNTVQLPANQWCLVIGVWTGTTTQILVNDVVRGSGSYSTAPNSTGHNVEYGAYQPGRTLAGTLGLCFAYNRALSSTELTAIFNATRGLYGV